MELFLGVCVSLLLEAIKKYFKTDPFVTMVILVGVSLICSTLYYTLSTYTPGFWAASLQILAYAGAFHNFILRRMADPNEK